MTQNSLVEDLKDAVALAEPNVEDRQALFDCAISEQTGNSLRQQLNTLSESGLLRAVVSAPTTWFKGYQIVGRLHSIEWVALLSGKLQPSDSEF